MSREGAGANEFTDVDLARRLSDAAGGPPDAGLALSSLRTRVVAARRRRTRFAVVAFVVGITGVGSAVAIQSRRSVTVNESNQPSTGVQLPLTTDAPVPTTLPEPSTTSIVTTTTVPTTPPATNEPAEVPPVVQPTDHPADPPAGSEATAPPAPAPTAPTPPRSSQPAGTASQTITSQGGSIHIDVVDHALVLSEVQPAAGRHVSKQAVDDDRIVVEFSSDDWVSTIEVDLVDGVASGDVRERDRGDGDGSDHGGGSGGGSNGGSSTPESWPSSTAPGDRTGPGRGDGPGNGGSGSGDWSDGGGRGGSPGGRR
jgi:hypothetical protein